eukprot:ANDGO_07551.mRNA.1 Suppressor of Ty 6 homolog
MADSEQPEKARSRVALDEDEDDSVEVQRVGDDEEKSSSETESQKRLKMRKTKSAEKSAAVPKQRKDKPVSSSSATANLASGSASGSSVPSRKRMLEDVAEVSTSESEEEDSDSEESDEDEQFRKEMAGFIVEGNEEASEEDDEEAERESRPKKKLSRKKAAKRQKRMIEEVAQEARDLLRTDFSDEDGAGESRPKPTEPGLADNDDEEEEEEEVEEVEEADDYLGDELQDEYTRMHHKVFGDDFEFPSFEQYDEEEEDEERAADEADGGEEESRRVSGLVDEAVAALPKLVLDPNVRRMQLQYEPELLKKKLLTDSDLRLAFADVPERLQQAGIHENTNPSSREISEEVDFLISRYGTDFKLDFVDPQSTSTDQLDELARCMARALHLILVEHLDVPFICLYRREKIGELSEGSVWNLLSHHREFVQLSHQRSKIADRLRRLPEFMVETRDELFGRLIGTSGHEQVEDVMQFLLCLERISAADLAEHLPEHLRKNKRQDAFEQMKTPRLRRFLNYLSIDVNLFSQNLELMFAQNTVSDTVTDMPLILASRFTEKGFGGRLSSSEDVLRTSRTIFARDYSCVPQLRAILRRHMLFHGLISTDPTPKGRNSITDPSHEFFSVHHLVGKPIRTFVSTPLDGRLVENFDRRNATDETFLLIQRAADEGLLTIRLHFSSSTKKLLEESEILDAANVPVNLLSMVQTGRSDAVSAAWNAERTLIMEEALDKYVIPQLQTEVVSFLHRVSKKRFLRRIQQSLQRIVAFGPLQVTESDRTIIRTYSVLSIVPKEENRPCAMVLLNEAGEVRDFHVFEEWVSQRAGERPTGGISKAREEKFIAQFRDFVESNRIDVVCVGAESMETSSILQYVRVWIQNQNKNIPIHVLPCDVARLYAQSSRSQKEFPQHGEQIRKAISLGRRLQDPLEESSGLWDEDRTYQLLPLAEDTPSNLANYETQEADPYYEQMVDPTRKNDYRIKRFNRELLVRKQGLVCSPNMLSYVTAAEVESTLDEVMCRLVSTVGVDFYRIFAHPFSASMLQFIAGFGPRKAAQFMRVSAARQQLQAREDLLNTPDFHVGPVVYQSCAGFFRVSQSELFGGLETTRIHPDQYAIAACIAAAKDLDDMDSSTDPRIVVARSQDGEIAGWHSLTESDKRILASCAAYVKEELERKRNCLRLQESQDRLETFASAIGVPASRLQFVVKEIIDSFTDHRKPLRTMSSSMLFWHVSRESPRFIKVGGVVKVHVDNFKRPLMPTDGNRSDIRRFRPGLSGHMLNSHVRVVVEGYDQLCLPEDMVRDDAAFVNENDNYIRFLGSYGVAPNSLTSIVIERVAFDRFMIFGTLRGIITPDTPLRSVQQRVVDNFDRQQRELASEALSSRERVVESDEVYVEFDSESLDKLYSPDPFLVRIDVATEEANRRKDASKNRLIRRNIDHPDFANISGPEAHAYLANRGSGKYVFRPSRKSVNQLSCTIRFYGQHQPVMYSFDIDEHDKLGAQLGLGRRLTVRTAEHGVLEFGDLDDLAQQYIEPWLRSFKAVTEHRKFIDVVNEDTALERLAQIGGQIPYFITIDYNRPGRFIIYFLYQGKLTQTGFYASQKEYRFSDKYYPNVESVLNEFKRSVASRAQAGIPMAGIRQGTQGMTPRLDHGGFTPRSIHN